MAACNWRLLFPVALVLSGCTHIVVTNCPDSATCPEPAMVETVGFFAWDISLHGEGVPHGVIPPGLTPSVTWILKPGRYQVDHFSEEIAVIWRDLHYTIDLQANHRYTVYSDDCMWSFGLRRLCKEGKGGSYVAVVLWIEDTTTGEVITGEKWCEVDKDCGTRGRCLILPARTIGTCDIPAVCERSADSTYQTRGDYLLTYEEFYAAGLNHKPPIIRESCVPKDEPATGPQP